MKKTVFPDVDLLLTFRSLDEIDLPQLLQCSAVEVVLASIVIEALADLQWRHPVPELRRRAQGAVEQIDTWLNRREPLRADTTIISLSARPARETMERYRLDWQRPGDLLCGILLEYQRRHSETAFLLSGEESTRRRAAELGLQTASLPDEYRLPEPRTTVEQEKQRAQDASEVFHFRASALKLAFQGDGDELVVSLASQLPALTPAMEAQLGEVRDQAQRELTRYYPSTGAGDPDEETVLGPSPVGARSPTLPDSFPDIVSDEASESYQDEVERYPAKFEAYLHQLLETINKERRTVRLDLVLANEGAAPAAAIHLTLTLPRMLQWYRPVAGSGRSSPPLQPVPPWLEGQTIASDFQSEATAFTPSGPIHTEAAAATPASAPRISNGGTTLEWYLGTERHRQSRDLPPLYARFRRPEDIGDFAVDYVIEDQKRSTPVQGHLSVTVTVRPEEPSSR